VQANDLAHKNPDKLCRVEKRLVDAEAKKYDVYPI
jgi:hypothetical protein